MTVYVDDVRHNFGRMVMCHMWADTEEELFAMVDKIGVQRKRIQRPPEASWVHFDISIGKKRQAIKFGAIMTDKYGPIRWQRARKDGLIPSISQVLGEPSPQYILPLPT
jgi:hypothetical protein